MVELDGCTVRPWPTVRNAVVTLLEQHREHTVYGSTEVDFTLAAERISKCTRNTGLALSHHSYILHCLALAAAEQPAAVTFKRGNKLVTFTEIDVGTVIEKPVRGAGKVPVGYIFRAAQSRTLAETNSELREACRSTLEDDPLVRWRRRMAKMPLPIRRLQAARIKRDPLLLKKYHGVIGLTNVQMRGLDQPFFGFPTQIYTITVAVGSLINKVQWCASGGTVTRKMLCLTAGADHAVIDGMGMARFAQSFSRYIESGTSLNDDYVEATRKLCIKRGRA